MDASRVDADPPLGWSKSLPARNSAATFPSITGLGPPRHPDTELPEGPPMPKAIALALVKALGPGPLPAP